MKHIMKIQAFSFNKILDGSKTIDLRLFDEKHQIIRPNDIIEFVCEELKERVLCLVKAFLVFDTADNMIDVLPPSLFGYPNREEIKVRVRRIFSIEDQLKYSVMGIIIECLDKKGNFQKREANSLDDADQEIARAYGEKYRPVARKIPSPGQKENFDEKQQQYRRMMDQKFMEKNGRE